MKHELTVAIQEPLTASHISIDIATIGWQTVRYKIYENGTTNPDIIPTSPNLYIVRISYKDSLASSQIYIHSNQAAHSDFNFNLLQQDDTIVCHIASHAYPELNKTVRLKRTSTDTDELIKELTKRMKE